MQVKEMKSSQESGRNDTTHRTIFYDIFNSDLPIQEKSDARLYGDGRTVVIAGTLTTSWALCVAVFYLLSQPKTLRILKDELRTVLQGTSSPVTLSTLEQLPYLSGCIRLSYGVSTRLQRIAPDETLIFNDGKKYWFIPPGTPVGMTSVFIHHNESIFPESTKFIPERWIGHPGLDKYLVSFSKGTRQCLGINLAYAEIYILLAKTFRAYGSTEVRDSDDSGYLELFDTTLYDVSLGKDIFIPAPSPGSKGVRIVVKK